ncbi:acetylornithine aminotransferase [Jatrophihabitans sp. GAS493]|uniref:acetylornithine transaminase n=1 Tax=Jatrophihabitans sp. GAS493 TaxID=1907575 RepID=UPI000BB8D93E|nr:acetylornithine transaminase [Jatrophihabitans sp. GAS493]SOD73778.1 acetylornithine aminotransferase [Jatrophihabitans sp. GAS493]
MSSNSELRSRWGAVMMNNYGTPPIALSRGAGVSVWDADGNEYLDFVGGIAVSSLGHAHPAIVAAVSEQVTRLAHTSNLVIHEPGVRLAEKLQELLGDGARTFFANSGTEANECAIKLSRKYGRQLSPDGSRLGIVASNGGFHGRTLGSLAITGNPSKRTPFEPLPGPVTFVDFGDVQALRTAVDETTAAVFLETTLGEGGVVPAPAGFLAAARAICDEAGALLVIDEVQSGIGRTGQWFASQAEGVRPDILTLAKGLGGGLPIGACIAFGPAAELFDPGDHGSTFGGNPISCAAALAVITTIQDEHLLDSVKRVGESLAQQLLAINSPLVADVRGSGLWRALALRAEVAADVELAARQHGLLVNAVKADVIRLAPPLTVQQREVDSAVQRLATALTDVSGEIS